MSFFKILCFGWAALGIGSRIGMVLLGRRWAAWETRKAYSKSRPAWVVAVGVLGLLLIAYTWYRVFTDSVAYDWVIAALLSLTGVKAIMFLFRYHRFREFVVQVMADRTRLRKINVAVVAFSIVLVAMGIFVY